ncbi:hypothetical protein MJ575_22790 [Klebsiella pneumoniae]|nr:hypothetical protein MJ575_22790 [Klebsiella pneumoniae]
MDRQAPTGLPPTGPTGAWLRYKKQFITPDNVQNGVVFLESCIRTRLNRAYQVWRRAAGNHCRHYRRGDSLGPGGG